MWVFVVLLRRSYVSVVVVVVVVLCAVHSIYQRFCRDQCMPWSRSQPLDEGSWQLAGAVREDLPRGCHSAKALSAFT